MKNVKNVHAKTTVSALTNVETTSRMYLCSESVAAYFNRV